MIRWFGLESCAHLVLERPLHLLVTHCQLCSEGNLNVMMSVKVIIIRQKSVKVIIARQIISKSDHCQTDRQT